MRNRVGGVYVDDNKMLLVHRIKEIEGGVREYYVLPGGGVEEGEDFHTALLREMKEEIGVDVIKYSDDVKYSVEDRDNHYYYEIYEISGEIGTGCGPEFTDESYKDHGKYLIEMVDIKDIVDGKIEIVPREIREQIIENYKR